MIHDCLKACKHVIDVASDAGFDEMDVDVYVQFLPFPGKDV